MKKENFTVSVYTENHIGLLNRITSIFIQRHINIESMTVSESEIKGVHRFTLIVKVTLDQIKKLVKQLEKQVEIIKAYYHTLDETIFQEIALFKISTEKFFNNTKIEKIINKHNASIVSIDKDFIVIQKTCLNSEADTIYKDLQPLGLMQFVRSGRIAITKPQMLISEALNIKSKF